MENIIPILKIPNLCIMHLNEYVKYNMEVSIWQ